MLAVVLSLLAPVDGRPCPSDLLHFPHPSVCMVEIEHADARITCLAAAKGFRPQDMAAHEREEARTWRVRQCWAELLNVHRNMKNGTRDQLARFRELLGFDDYYEGRMPSLCP